MNPTSLTNLSSLVKVGALTFAGSFLGALTLTSIPTTLDGWKMLVMPALGAAVAAEIVYLRSVTGQALAGGIVPTPSAVTAKAEVKS